MSGLHQPCSPGGHSHSDRPNWRPADEIVAYLANCQEGLETYSDCKAAKLWGISRAELWRWKIMSSLPDDLFEMLLNSPRRQSSKSLAAVAVALQNGGPVGEVERCPHCGGTLRVRPSVSRENIKIVVQWMNKREAAEARR